MPANLENAAPMAMPSSHESYFAAESGADPKLCKFMAEIALESPELADALLSIGTADVGSNPVDLKPEQAQNRAIEKELANKPVERDQDVVRPQSTEKPSLSKITENTHETTLPQTLKFELRDEAEQIKEITINPERIPSSSSVQLIEEINVQIERSEEVVEKLQDEPLLVIEEVDAPLVNPYVEPEEVPEIFNKPDAIEPIQPTSPDVLNVVPVLVTKSESPMIIDNPISVIEQPEASPIIELAVEQIMTVDTNKEELIIPSERISEHTEEPLPAATYEIVPEGVPKIAEDSALVDWTESKPTAETLPLPDELGTLLGDEVNLHESALQDLSFDAQLLTPAWLADTEDNSTPVEAVDLLVEATPSYSHMITELPASVEQLDPEEQEKVHDIIETILEVVDSEEDSIEALETAVDELCEILGVDLSEEEKTSFIKVLICAPQESIQSIIRAEFTDEPHDRGTHERLHKFSAFIQSLQDIFDTNGLVGRIALKASAA